MNDYFDNWTLITILMTFILFAAAFFVKGITHDLFLEAGVFLVSVKLVLMGYRNHVALKEIKETLADIQKFIQKNK